MPAGAKEVQVLLTFKDDGSYDLKRVVKEINTTLNAAGVQAETLGEGFEKLKGRVQSSGSGFSKLTGILKSSFVQMAAGFGAVMTVQAGVAALTKTIKDTVEKGKAFEEAFTRITVVSGETAEGNERLRQSVLRMNPALGSATEMTNALATAMREFKEYSRADQLKFVETAGRTAVAAFTNTGAAMEALSTVVKGYKMDLSDASKAGEVLARATQIEGVQFEELARGLTKLSATASQVGVSFSELIGSYLTLAERQDPQLAMMQLRMLLTNLLKPSNQAQAEAKRLGIEWSAAGVQAMGFVNWLKKLNQVTAGSAEVLDNLVPGGRQMIGMLELVGNNARETAEKVGELNKAWEKGGVVEAAFHERLKSTGFLMDTAKEVFSRFQISIFEGFSQPLLEGITSQDQFEKRLKEVTDSVVEFGKSIGSAMATATKVIKDFAEGVKYDLQAAKEFFATMAGAPGGLADRIIGPGANIDKLKLWSDALQKLFPEVDPSKAMDWRVMVKGLGDEMERVTGDFERNKEVVHSLMDLWKKSGGDMGKFIESAMDSGGMLKTLVLDLANGTTVLADAYKKTKSPVKDVKGAVDELSDAEKAHILALNRAREEMKKYGFTFKTELLDRYEALKLGLETFKSEMSAADYEKLKGELKRLGAELGVVNRALVELNLLTKTETALEMKKVEERLSGLRGAFAAGLITLDVFKQGLDQINESLKKLDPTLTATTEGMTKLVETKLPAGRTLNVSAPGAMPLEQGVELSIEEMKKALASLGPSIAYLTELETGLGAPLKELAKRTLPDFESKFKAAMAVGGFSTENLKKAADSLIQHYKDAGEEVPQWLARLGTQTTTVWAGVAETMVQYWTQAMAQMVESGLNFRDVVNVTWQTLAAGAGKTIGNMAEKALSSLGAMAGPIGGLVGSLAGSLVSGIGKLFGIKSKAQKEAEAAKKAAAELKKQVEATQKAYSSFGKISDETAKKIVEMTKAVNKQTATLVTLTDVMNDAGITSKNFQQYLAKMTQGLRDMARGSVEASKGIDAIGSAFSNLVSWAQKMGQEGNKALVAFIQNVRKLGVSIKEIDDYVYGQLETGASGLKGMMEAFGGSGYEQLLKYKDEITNLTEEVQTLQKSRLDTREQQADFQLKKNQLLALQENYRDLASTLAESTGPELERISNLTVTMFNSMVAQGMSAVDVFEKMADPLSQLKTAYETLGITGGAAIQQLFKMSDVSAANRDLFAGIEGNKQVLEALGNTGFLTAASLEDVAGQAGKYYDKLTMAGLTSKEALSLMSPTLADIDYYAKQLGITLDDSTRTLIEQSKAAGLFKEKGLDMATVMKNGFGDVVDRLDKLIYVYEGKRGGKGEEIAAQSGFYGTVTGPKRFYIEPGVTEHVSITKPGAVATRSTPVKVEITLNPVVLRDETMRASIIKFVEEASKDESIIINPRSVR